MRIAVDDEWYWLRMIAEQLSEQSGHDPYDLWADIFLPAMLGIATLVVAGTSVYVAFQSHRTSVRGVDAAERANHLTEEYRDQERREKGRQRRSRLVATLQQRYLQSVVRAMQNTPDVPTSEEEKKLRDLAMELDESDELGRLRSLLYGSATDIRDQLNGQVVELPDAPDWLTAKIYSDSSFIESWARDVSVLDEMTRRQAYLKVLQAKLAEYSNAGTDRPS